MILEITDFRIHLTHMLLEQIVILTQHPNIGIIVPRDITLMPDGSEEASSKQDVVDIVLSANPVKFDEHFQFDQLHLSKLFWG